MMKNLDKYLAHIKADYVRWQGDSPSEFQKQMIQEFIVETEKGSKYLKIVLNKPGNSRSVHSFICLKDMGKFKEGDILKAAGWAAPARNFARANLYENNFQNVRWTGA